MQRQHGATVGWLKVAAAAATAGALAVGAVVLPTSATGQESPTGDLPISPEFLANTLTRGAAVGRVKNNTIPGAIDRRNQAKADWEAANARYRGLLATAKKAKGKKRPGAVKAAQGAYPSPLAKPEYSVVWAAKQNGGDIYAGVISNLIQNATVNPQGLADLLGPEFAPGLDGFQVIDVRKLNTDGSENADYGKVVNFVQLPMPWGVETEAHHMQYQWEDGQPIVAGGLYNGANFVMDPKDIPNLTLQNVISQPETPLGSITDAYDAVGDGRFIATHMGGPISNFGGSPGAVYTLKPDAQKGLVFESETPGGNIGGIAAKNAGGVPEPCSLREARPLGTCANPHGIEVRKDINTMITSDYAEPREIVLDPVKTLDKYSFRPTNRTWDVSNPARPVLKAVAHMPAGWRKPAQRAHTNYGIMESAKTWPTAGAPKGTLKSKGFFSGSMCGGGIFFNPDPADDRGDSSSKWVQVWDDGLSQLLTKGGNPDNFIDDPGGCAGGAWHQVSRNNKWFFRSVQGRVPGGVGVYDQGSTKLIYNLDIEPLIKSAQDGKVDCDLTNGIDTDGNGTKDLSAIKAVHRLGQGQTVADCPRFLDGLPVKDPTSGGPHWAALDNHSITPDGYPTRLNFSNYFVSRTGVDGDHRYYEVDVDPQSGKMSYDQTFRDENTGALGLNFNRRDWPGSKDAGFYKPHSMVFVCPPGICPKDATNAELPPVLAKRLRMVLSKGWMSKLRRAGSAKARVVGTGDPVTKVRVIVRDRKGRTVARSRTLKSMSASGATLTVKRTKAMRRGRRYRVTVLGYTAAGKRVGGQTRTLKA